MSGHIPGAIVLDLFAGTGALGIEALSRGADFAVFVDIYQTAVAVIERNIRSSGLEDSTRIIRWDIVKNLDCLKHNRLAFDLVFMDPPYNKSCIKPTLLNLHKSSCLKKGAAIIVEHSLSEPIPADDVGVLIDDQRRYGKTLVSIISYMIY